MPAANLKFGECILEREGGGCPPPLFIVCVYLRGIMGCVVYFVNWYGLGVPKLSVEEGGGSQEYGESAYLSNLSPCSTSS